MSSIFFEKYLRIARAVTNKLDKPCVKVYNVGMKLNVKKIKKELDRLGMNQSELARLAKVSRAVVWYWFDTGSDHGAEKIAKALGYSDAKDLII